MTAFTRNKAALQPHTPGKGPKKSPFAGTDLRFAEKKVGKAETGLSLPVGCFQRMLVSTCQVLSMVLAGAGR